MTDEWLYPIILKEEEDFFEKQTFENEEDVFLDYGINEYFHQNGF